MFALYTLGNLPPPINTGIETQVVASAVTVWLLQWIKNLKSIPWISQDTGKLNRAISVLLAAAAAVGIHVTFDNGTLMITGLTVAGIVLAAVTWLKAFAFNEIIYQAAYNKTIVQAPPTSPPPSPPNPNPSPKTVI